jgi:hypothetical protein
MGFKIDFSVLNQKGTPALYTDTFANRPPFGYAGRLFIANDTSAIYEDTGSAWVLIANVSSGAGTLQQVTTNGNTSNVGISVTAGGISTNSATITSLTQGSVPFVGAAGLITQDNTNLFFDDTNNRLGINTNTPSNNLDVHGTGTSPLIAINNTAGNQSLIGFAKNSTAKWRIGNSATDTFDIVNVALSLNAISIDVGSTVKFATSPKIKNGTGLSPEAGFGAIGFLISGVIFQRDNSTNKLFFDFGGFTAQRTFICPDADGTLALTSNLSAYLPLTGGTLTGNLSGTSANFVSTLQANNLIIKNTSVPAAQFYRDLDVAIVGDAGQGIEFGARNGTNFISGAAIYGGLEVGGTTGQLVFQTLSAGSLTTKMFISNIGNVLINSLVDDTINKLQVNGNAKVTKITSLEDSFTTIAGGATATIFTVAASQMYLCYCTQGATNVQVTFTVSVAEGSATAIVGVLSTSGATLIISASGLNIQATNGAGPTITAKTTYIRIK